MKQSIFYYLFERIQIIIYPLLLITTFLTSCVWLYLFSSCNTHDNKNIIIDKDSLPSITEKSIIEDPGFDILRAYHRGRFSKGESWELVIEKTGKAILKVGNEEYHFYLHYNDLNNINIILHDSDYINFKTNKFGRFVPDGSVRSILVKKGDVEKEVCAYYLSDISEFNDKYNQKEFEYFIRLWFVVRGLFDIPDAHDGRKYLKRFLSTEK